MDGHSMNNFATEQESFWAGTFGNEYIQRNQDENLLAANLAFFSNALRSAGEIKSCIEFGANIGMNLKALRLLYPGISLNAIEINPKAAELLASVIGRENILIGSILEQNFRRQCELSLIKGVLIHINPEHLKRVYEKLYEASSKYILITEYYNPTPVELPYRGHANRLYKRDFAGEMLDMFPKLRLREYGFAYRRDRTEYDDWTWFLLEK